MNKCNIFVGRLQPLHSGHVQAIKDAYVINHLPTFIFYIDNKVYDKHKPFGNDLISKELSIVKENEDVICGYTWLRRPYPGLICRILLENNYEPVLWICGEDRIEEYKKLLNPEKIRNELNINPPSFYVSHRYCSGTEVREAILRNDFEKYQNLMPLGTLDLYDDFYKQLKKVYNG